MKYKIKIKNNFWHGLDLCIIDQETQKLEIFHEWSDNSKEFKDVANGQFGFKLEGDNFWDWEDMESEV